MCARTECTHACINIIIVLAWLSQFYLALSTSFLAALYLVESNPIEHIKIPQNRQTLILVAHTLSIIKEFHAPCT